MSRRLRCLSEWGTFCQLALDPHPRIHAYTSAATWRRALLLQQLQTRLQPAPGSINPLGAAAAGALAADDIDAYEINRDHVLADALKCTQIRRPAAPASLQVPRFELQGKSIQFSSIQFNAIKSVAQNRLTTL